MFVFLTEFSSFSLLHFLSLWLLYWCLGF